MRSALLLWLLFSPFIRQQDDIGLITASVKHGNAHEVAAMFMTSVDMTINNTENIYSSQQAELVLSDFFKNNHPKNVQQLHRISSSASFHFVVLMVDTSTGTYRLAFSLKNSGGKFMVSELRIESEKSK